MNPKLSELADKDSVYKDAPPMLFGDQFAKEAKERRATSLLGQSMKSRKRPTPTRLQPPPSGFKSRGRHERWATRPAQPQLRKGTLPPIQKFPKLSRKRELSPQREGEGPAIKRRAVEVEKTGQSRQFVLLTYR